MYNDEVNRIPVNEDDLWLALREQFEFAAHVLWELPIESEIDAINGPAKELPTMNRIRFRSIGEQLDQRDHFLKMGRELLPYVDQAIDERQMTPEFVQQWGKIMFCHGYIASYVFDDADGMAQKRGGMQIGRARSKQSQRKWLAHLIIGLVDEEKITRDKAEERVAAYIEGLLRTKAFPAGFGHDWFGPIITRGGLAATYDGKHFSLNDMRALLSEPVDDIPPIPAKVP